MSSLGSGSKGQYGAGGSGERGVEVNGGHISEAQGDINFALKISCFLLETKIALQNVPTSNPSVILTPSDLPLPSSNQIHNFKKIYLSCQEKALNYLQFSISCYSRAIGVCPDLSWPKELWSSISLCAQEVAAEMALNQLVQDACGDSEDDLWSSFYGNQAASSAFSNFLERLSGWPQDQISPDMSRRIFSLAKDSLSGSDTVIKMVKAGGRTIRSIEKLDDLLLQHNKLLDGIDNALGDASCIEILSQELLNEIKEAKKGDYFEANSTFAGFLSISMVIDKLSPLLLAGKKYSCFVELRNFPEISSSDVSSCSTHLQDAFHRCQKTVKVALMKILKSSQESKSNVLAWMAAMVSLNELRAGPRFRKEELKGACSDGFMLNVCAVFLLLCKPFFTAHTSGPKLALISPTYPSSPVCRLDQKNEICLAQGVITMDRSSEGHTRFLGKAPPNTPTLSSASSLYKFVTECFFITQRALHVGLIPAVNTFSKMVSDLGGQLSAEGGGGGGGAGRKDQLKKLYVLYQLAWFSSLMDPEFVQHCCDFYITQAVWITKQIESCLSSELSEEEVCEKQRKLLSGLPEFCVKDMASWFKLVAQFKPKLLQGLQLTPMVDCCVGLLERPDLLPDPLAQSRIVSTLLIFVNSDKRGLKTERLLGSHTWGGILGELSTMVQGNPSVRDNLGPALLHTYAAVSAFEGLDVDRENFDKYATRYEVAQLLRRLWGRPDCRASIIRECGSKKFQSFLGAVFDTLLYQLNDAFSRLVNVKKAEAAKESGQWKTLSPSERREKEVFLSNEQRTSRGFMTQANQQMELLDTMSEVESVARCLSLAPLGTRTAAAFLGFLNILCGPNASNLKVKEMEKYSFDPTKLVVQIISILVRVWIQDQKSVSGKGLTSSLAHHPDFSSLTLAKCSTVLQKTRMNSELLKGFSNMMEQILKVLGDSPESSSGAGNDSENLSTLPSSEDWQEEADASIIEEDSFREIYVSAMEDSKFDSAELEGVHTLTDKAQVSLDPRSPMIKAILRDMKQLQESDLIHPDSAVFVRQDEDHIDLVRVMITGPTGTPYSRGCFVFDVYYPASFPNNPPLVIMTTTGGGTIRFNPNLYADGKVCLSLLGTWHGGDATEKWDPTHSNLLQVILSIQGLIMIPDPVFNEPGYEATRGTEDGNERSRDYNADIQIYTIRYAMLEQLRNPPEGFKDAIPVHFALQREAILKQCSQWLKEAISPQHKQKLSKAIDELRAELDKQ